MSTERSSLPAGLAGTGLVHGLAIVALVLLAQRAPPTPPIVYAVDLIAAPAPSDAPRRAAAEATPAAEVEQAPILPPKLVKPEPPKPTPSNQVKVVDKAPVTKSTVTPIPEATPSTGQDVVTVSQAGISFEYPEYLRNIMNQIYVRWQQPLAQTNLHVEVTFVIQRDGSVRDLVVSKPSGRYDFDLTALGAVEATGRARAFNPLPSGYVGDGLPIAFYFSPTRKP
ncbi:MAG: TonB C-terminal domain-containing protein [Gemmatimonadota bacterium]